jgi:hypothetical protein
MEKKRRKGGGGSARCGHERDGGPTWCGKWSGGGRGLAPTAAQPRWRRAVVNDQWNRGGGAIAVSCWAGCRGPKLNGETFDLFNNFKLT